MTPDLELPLRDIHLPDPVAWWPPAVGWWIAVPLLVLTLYAGARFLRWLRHRRRLQKAALRTLDRIFRDLGRHQNQQQLLRETSVLLRRVALTHYPRESVAALTGGDWLRFLDQSLAGSAHAEGFSQGAGRVLANGPYTPSCEIDTKALHRLCAGWIRALPAGSRR